MSNFKRLFYDAYPRGWDLRNGRITKPHIAEVPVNIAETLTGHAVGNVHEQYVHKELISMKPLQEGLEKLRYDFIVQDLYGEPQLEPCPLVVKT